ncbi:tetrahydrodipicolinate succinylase [Candidatus Tremblaya phenacola PAVE]|nr:tetrahydrodipicolinate succinylase [Candidatus Tremblaya phenacola PAVE]
MSDLKEIIGKLWECQNSIGNINKNREVYEIVDTIISHLDEGRIRVCDKFGGEWKTNDWIKKAILLYFQIERAYNLSIGCLQYFDKILPKNLRGHKNNFRIVPPTIIRRGSFISEGVILMPSFVNIGSFVGKETMIDTWSTVGSCAQIGSGVHISGGVGIGGVLEPTNAQPVIIEDGSFIGARSEIAEGVLVGAGSVVSMGTFLGKSTKIFDRQDGNVSYGKVPSNSVLVPGCLLKDAKYGLSCAVIVKKVDGKTKSKTELNNLLRC